MCTRSGEASRAGSGPLWIWQLGGFAADPPNRLGLNLSVDHEDYTPPHALLLSTRCERPRSRRAADKRNELAAADHRMTAFVIALRASRA